MRRSHPCATQAANDRAEQLRRNTYWAPALASTFLTPRYKGDLAATYAETAAVRDALHAHLATDAGPKAVRAALDRSMTHLDRRTRVRMTPQKPFLRNKTTALAALAAAALAAGFLVHRNKARA